MHCDAIAVPYCNVLHGLILNYLGFGTFSKFAVHLLNHSTMFKQSSSIFPVFIYTVKPRIGYNKVYNVKDSFSIELNLQLSIDYFQENF